MARISELTERKIKDAANVVDVISDFYELHRSGRYYECLCPFHHDRHVGSFKVSESHNTYTCFSCGAHGGPVDFIMQHEHLNYPDALRWLGRKYGIEVEGAGNFHPKPSKPHAPTPPLPMLTLPVDYVAKRMDTKRDTLCNWLRSLPWPETARQRVEPVLENYGVGHARQGHTIFWQIDDRMRVRTGKMMMYTADGHRDRKTAGNFHWVHNLLFKAGKVNLNKYQFMTTLFGMHLLNYYPNAQINIVESEKTALMCAMYWGNSDHSVWMASGGLTFITRERLKPIIEAGRKVMLFPDRDGVKKWREQAGLIGYDNLSVSTYYLDNYWDEADGQKADLGDTILRLVTEGKTTGNTDTAARLQPTKEELLKAMVASNAAVGKLIKTFNLQLI